MRNVRWGPVVVATVAIGAGCSAPGVPTGPETPPADAATGEDGPDPEPSESSNEATGLEPTTGGDASSSTDPSTGQPPTGSSSSGDDGRDDGSGGSSSSTGSALDTWGDEQPMCDVCTLDLLTEATGVIAPVDDAEFTGEVFLDDDLVFATRYSGHGRAVFHADLTEIGAETGDCDVWAWLGETPTPRILSFGWITCSANQIANGPSRPLSERAEITWADNSLPEQYIGDAAALREDYDIVLYCLDWNDPLPDGVAQTVVDFVQLEGGGAYLASDFAHATPSWGGLNDMAMPLGAEFLNQTGGFEDLPTSGELGILCEER